MKYIRTKDNQFITLCANEKEWATLPKSQTGGLSYKEWFDLITKNVDILKQADTIDKLCDEFVLFAPYRFRKPKTATELEKDFEEMKYFYTDKNDTIYGAIWTDKGLIYVAKINEKRELELL